jgi:hypothetical protein
LRSDSQEVLLKENQVYDTAVDVVSCWESACHHLFSGDLEEYHFDRFPSLSQGDREVTPDFAIYFEENYGVIGEIKRTFPDDRAAMVSELEQLCKYDEPLPLKTATDEQIPQTCDTLLIIEGSAAPQIGTRLQRIIDDGDISFEIEPVLIRYQFNQDAMQSRYEFQRVTELEFGFNDDKLSSERTLSEVIGESSDYGTLPVYPKHFVPYKTQKPLCNDQPPGQYIPTFLWHKIFPQFLTEEDYERWQATNGQKGIDIETSVDELVELVNEYMQVGSVRRQWISDAVEFLDGADLAERDGQECEINFMGIVPDTGGTSQQGMKEVRKSRELARRIVSRYCGNRKEHERETASVDDDEDGEDNESEQASLDNFG